MNTQKYISARKDPKVTVIEGFHSLKHAIRFAAEIEEIVTPDMSELMAMANKLAPYEAKEMEQAIEINQEDFDAATPYKIKSGVIALAKRKYPNPKIINETEKPVIWLDNPKNHENVGAVIRLAAGLDLGAVVVSGDMDVWNPGVVRGSTGLHFAIPVLKTEEDPSEFGKPIFVFDDKGADIAGNTIPKKCIAVFGSERHGVSDQIKEAAEQTIALPMKSSVSSYNLATSVAMAMYEITRG